MIQLDLPVPLTACHICHGDLIPHPLYAKSGTMYCPKDGDFFVQKLRNQSPTVYFFEFDADEISEEIIEEIEEQRYRRNGHPGFPIRCDQTGIIYPSITEACKTLKIASTSVFKFFKGERRSVGGYTFTRVDGRPEDFINRPTGLDKYAIVCNETGRVFSSIRHAADVMHLSREAIRGVIKGYRQNAGGYTFTQRGDHGRSK